MADAIFEDPRLAVLYDPFDPDRSDLDPYLAMADEFGAQRIVDLGCGTGTLACLLAARGKEVVGVDPAQASLDVARAKPGADRVRWIHGGATALPPLEVDLVVMTANVAQVFVTDEEWAATLVGIRTALRPGGRLVFESRVPERRAWERWTREHTFAREDIEGVGVVETWCDLGEVVGPLVSFRWTNVLPDGDVILSDSTLRFRGRDETLESLRAHGFEVDEVRDAPDRPGAEHVYVAHRPASVPPYP